MSVYPCAGCGRVVVVETVFCVDCSRKLGGPIAPRLRLAESDQPTELVNATLVFDVA